MIFVTTGTQKFPFDRLLKAVDEEIQKGTITEPVFAQTGASDYHPRFYESVKFMHPDEMDQKRKEASLILTHGGTNSIISALRLGKPVVAVPRLVKYKEHVDDHQKEILEEMRTGGLIVTAEEMDHLAEAIEEAKRKPSVIYREDGHLLIEYIEQLLLGGDV